jgi:hypothetical protein
MAPIHDLLDHWRGMTRRRDPWMPYWQELADVLLPTQASFVAKKNPGERRGANIYDGGPRMALRDLASTLDGLMKPKTAKWFDVSVDDPDIAEMDEVKMWLEVVQERMSQAIYRKDARFIQRSGEVDLNLACFGWGALWMQENRARNGLMFRSFHNAQVAIDENEEGVIDTIAVDEMRDAFQAAALYQRAGKEPHRRILEALKDPKKAGGRDFQIVQVVASRDRAAYAGFARHRMPFATVILDVKNEEIIANSGFEEFPAAVPRWETFPGEIYPSSPGMMALPDSQTLQAMGKTILVSGQRTADPPIWVLNDAVMSPLRTFPGGVTVLDATDGGTPVGTFPSAVNLPISRDIQQDYRRQVEAAFFKNVFNLPVEGPAMTAFEVAQRKQEFIRVIGPVFGRLESDYIGHIVERVFGIMERAGALPPRPDILMQTKVSFRFQSPIQQARKQIEIAGMSQSLQLLAPLAQAQPEILDNFDGDEIARDAPEWGGISRKWMRNKRRVEELRAARQQQGEAGQTLTAAQPVSEAIKNVAMAEAALQR